MPTEIDLIHVLKNRTNYDRFIGLVKDHTLTDTAKIIIEDMGVFFAAVDPEIDWETFATWFKMVRHPKMGAKQYAVYAKVFDTLDKHTTTAVADEIVKHFVLLDYTGRILDHGNNIIDGKADSLGPIDILLTDYNKEARVTVTDDDSFIDCDLDSILDVATSTSGYEWRLEDMNRSIGPVRKGDFIVVAARPEVGKTSFAACETSYWATQMKDENDCVLWFNNEEEGNKIMLRNYETVLNAPYFDVVRDIKHSKAEYARIIGHKDRIQVFDRASIHVRDVERVVAERKPKVIIFNILDKVKGFEKSGTETERLRNLSQWARELAKEHGVVMALAQADGSAEGQQWIRQQQLYGSKTGIQGEADVLITIGKLHDPAFENDRYIHVPKNKMNPGPRTETKEKHGYFEVKFDQDCARYNTVRYK